MYASFNFILSSFRKLIVVFSLLFLLIQTENSQAQFSATWPCSSDGNPVITGGITATAVSVIGATSLGVVTCNAVCSGNAVVTGYAANNWPTDLKTCKCDYFEVTLAPKAGYTITVTDISVDMNDGYPSCCPHPNDYAVFYSIDAFAHNTKVAGNPGTTNGNRTWLTASKAFSQVVSPGTTLTLHVYFDTNGDVDATIRGYVRNISISGTQTPLPISLMNFSGEYSGNKCLLKWKTASEQNNDYFAIERSTDGKSWSTIGKVQGAGNSNTERDYEFIDSQLETLNLQPETIYYRLKQTDFNGQYENFGPVSVQLAPIENWKLVIKNPATDNELTGTLFTTEDGNVSLEIMDLQGRIIKTENINATKGSNLLNIDISNLERGLYLVKAYNNINNILSKFVKL